MGLRSALRRFSSPEKILDIRKDCPSGKTAKRALLFYKTAPFRPPTKWNLYKHPNNWEVHEMIRILNRMGFVVDLLDRSYADFDALSKEYDLFLGMGLTDSYAEIARRLPDSAVKICYATGAHPHARNKAIDERVRYVKQRRNVDIEPIRIKHVDMDRNMRFSDAIFCLGNHDYTIKTYDDYDKDMFRVYSSTDPAITFDFAERQKSDPKNFLFFAGDGLLHKGLDLLLDAFSSEPSLNLYVCAPLHQKDFIDAYRNELYDQKNIHTIGFIKTGSRRFNELASVCPFVILPSCSEAAATSVLTCMRKGMIPLVTKEAGVDIDDFGFMINDINVTALKDQLKLISGLSHEELACRSLKSYVASLDNTQAAFSKSFEIALLSVLHKHGKI